MRLENSPLAIETIDYIDLKENLEKAIAEKLMTNRQNTQLLRIQRCLTGLLKTNPKKPDELLFCGDKIRLLMLDYHLFQQGITSQNFIQIERPSAISYELEILNGVILGEHARTRASEADYAAWAHALAEQAYTVAGAAYETLSKNLSYAMQSAITYSNQFFKPQSPQLQEQNNVTTTIDVKQPPQL